MSEKKRCPWAGNQQIYIDYHDFEWGREVHDDQKLFEMLILEGAQAGLSWITILKKREAYRLAFDYFNPNLVALYDEMKIQELLVNPGIVRNKLKINATVNNAKCFLKVVEQYGSFNNFIWKYVDYKPILNHINSMDEIPVKTELSDRISRDLLKLGFKFVGSTIIYSFMQAIGMVNDHLTDCYVYQNLIKE